MTTTLEQPPKTSQKKQVKHNVDEDSLDVVRNILFGEQAKQTEQRRMELERLLEVSINSLREETEKKFKNISQELAALVNLLTDETRSRQSEFSQTRNSFNHLTQQLSQLEIKIQKEQSQLQEQIVNESNQTTQTIKRVNEELSVRLEHAVAQLRHEKADRKAIASLLSGVAKQLLDTDERS
jgi:hypothetical protein